MRKYVFIYDLANFVYSLHSFCIQEKNCDGCACYIVKSLEQQCFFKKNEIRVFEVFLLNLTKKIGEKCRKY